jgi:hypothetical protein
MAIADIDSLALVAAKMPVENRIAISIVPRVVHLQGLEDVFLHQGAADQCNPGAKTQPRAF